VVRYECPGVYLHFTLKFDRMHALDYNVVAGDSKRQEDFVWGVWDVTRGWGVEIWAVAEYVLELVVLTHVVGLKE
jgi:hypothetical protein